MKRQRGTWGGVRSGAGRPPRGRRSSERHETRPMLRPRRPVHVTARVTTAIGSLRRAPARSALERAVATSLARTDFRIVRLGIARSRLELIVEADDRIALARGMQGFQVAAARYLNASAARRGTVFLDRYAARTLATRRALRSALAAFPLRGA